MSNGLMAMADRRTDVTDIDGQADLACQPREGTIRPFHLLSFLSETAVD